jgi:hypothetical protein
MVIFGTPEHHEMRAWRPLRTRHTFDGIDENLAKLIGRYRSITCKLAFPRF